MDMDLHYDYSTNLMGLFNDAHEGEVEFSFFGKLTGIPKDWQQRCAESLARAIEGPNGQ